jgi:hypothetical protein
MPGSININGQSVGEQGATRIGPITITGSQTVNEVLQVALKAGDNMVTLPEGATAVVIVLPVNNSVAVKLRTNLNASDGGLPVANVGPTVLTFAPGTTSLILNAAGATSPLTLSFI